MPMNRVRDPHSATKSNAIAAGKQATAQAGRQTGRHIGKELARQAAGLPARPAATAVHVDFARAFFWAVECGSRSPPRGQAPYQWPDTQNGG